MQQIEARAEAQVKPIIDNLLALGRTRLIALAATGIGIVLALFFGLNTVMAPSFAPLYSDLSLGAASRVVSALEQDGFQVELSGGGAIVSVPSGDVPRARMSLAEKGLPDEGSPGWELFDQSSGLGMNTFMQQVSRLRALEGELARSIQTIEGIDAARVHLVMPDREAFSRSRPDPSASVIVRGRATQQISRRQGLAIRALVASAVPNLSPNRVTVLSASGETILSEEVDGEVTLQAAGASIEERLGRNITEILTARVGAGNARVQVNVDLSTEREVIRNQSFDPTQQVVRSSETRDEDQSDKETASGEVGVAGNLPPALAGDPAAGPVSANTSTRTDEIVNYEIGSTQSETVREPGAIQKVSVAVLVNGIYNVADDGTVSYEERGAEELDRLAQLVQSAIGYDAERGDAVSIDSLRFMDYSMDVGAPVGPSVGQVVAANFMSILRGVFALAVVAAVLFFGVTPVLRRFAPMDAIPALAGGDAAMLSAEMGPERGALTSSAPATQRQMLASAAPDGAALPDQRKAGALALPDSLSQHGEIMGQLDLQPEDLVTLTSVQGGVRRNRIEDIGELAESEAGEALRVLHGWLAEEA